ncbi:MAG TPA: adenosine deaminase [Streptosporangiaceae bacterium]|nr:adenosine deaminase [Streptosporangiaceae bacterium]
MEFPKIELHVHLEGTVRATTLLEIARRNGVALPADSPEGLAGLYEYRDFDHFIQTWVITTSVLRTERDFRQVVVDYAAEAASHGAVYLEGIFTPAEAVNRGAGWDEVFTGFCDGAQEARERHDVQVRLTPDIPRGYPMEAAELTARHAIAYRDRGVVGLGLGGLEAQFPPEPYAEVFALARDGGVPAVPHAGEAAGPASVRGALDVLHAVRIRHGIRAIEEPELVAELAERRIVLDVCPISNLRTGVVPALADHPLPALVAAGVPCSVSTDDPAMFGTDLDIEYQAVQQLGVSAEDCYLAGVEGALCDDTTRETLRKIGRSKAWPGELPTAGGSS